MEIAVALRLGGARLEDEPVGMLSTSIGSPTLELDSFWPGNCPGLNRMDDVDPRADERETTEDAGDPLGVGRFSDLVLPGSIVLPLPSGSTSPLIRVMGFALNISGSNSTLVSRQSRLNMFSADMPSSKARILPSILGLSASVDGRIPSPVIRAPNVSRDREAEFLTRCCIFDLSFLSRSRPSFGSELEGSPKFSIHSHGRLITGEP